MPTDCISYQSSGYFTPLIVDYLNQNEKIRQLYNRFPSVENFKGQIREKSGNYNPAFRNVLVDTLNVQYSHLSVSPLTRANIDALLDQNTFTITTGHQLNLFTGPLYFLYKIISAINLAKELKSEHPESNFVPVYWMATEDHDFEEINFFNFKGKKFRWNRESSGPVGKLATTGLDDVYRLFAMELGSGINAEKLKTLFENAYVSHENLTDATRYLANELFGEYGLVILDADDRALKSLFTPHVKDELLHQTSFKSVSKTNEALSDYTIQVNPRELNLFYINDAFRERVIFENDTYSINNTDLKFSREEMMDEANDFPERFSPNVIMRPLYQEVILPNLCYIGGGGEIAYWLELKAYFESQNITFPVLLVRNSVLLVTRKQAKKADALGLSWADLFTNPLQLTEKKTKELSTYPIDLTPQKDALRQQFDFLFSLAEQTDKSFTGAVKAQEVKQIKGLDALEKRLLKAQKRKYSDELDRIISLRHELFPFEGLQERQANFSEFYLEFGDALIPRLIAELRPLEHEFNVLAL